MPLSLSPSTFVCPTEIVAFSDKANEFHDANCEVVAVSVDSHFSHLAWINTPRKVPYHCPCWARGGQQTNLETGKLAAV